jgi:hypothetical protein
MNIKWALGAIVAVLSAMFVLPGIASAHNPHVNTDTECDGTFSIDADYSGGSGSLRQYVTIDGANWDDGYGGGSGGTATPPAGMSVTQDDSSYVATPGDDYFLFEDVPDQDGFFVLSGDYQSVQDNGGQVNVYVSQTLNYNGAPENSGATGTITAGTDGDQNANNDWQKCQITYCQDGDYNGGSDLSFLATPDNNCDPVRLCLDNGQSATVTEYDAESLLDNGATKGSCTPTENPPPPTPTPPTVIVEEKPPEEVAVADVSPAVEEVAALPSAGYGPASSGTGFNWTAGLALALALFGLGSSTALVARRK